MNYYERHLGDYARDTVHLSLIEHGVYTILLDRYYATEAPIPVDQTHRICRARTREEREAVDAVLREFFAQEDDGWHSARCDAEIARFRESVPDREARRANAKERQRRARERRAEMFEALRGHGIVPTYDAPTSELVTLLSRVTSHAVTQPITRDDTAIHTPDTRHQTPEKSKSKDMCAVAHVAAPAGASRFSEFWEIYPRKIAKAACEAKWRSKKCEAHADEIIANLKARIAWEWRGKDLQFIPHPATYLTQERWLDEIATHQSRAHPSVAERFGDKHYAGSEDHELPEHLRPDAV